MHGCMHSCNNATILDYNDYKTQNDNFCYLNISLLIIWSLQINYFPEERFFVIDIYSVEINSVW